MWHNGRAMTVPKRGNTIFYEPNYLFFHKVFYLDLKFGKEYVSSCGAFCIAGGISPQSMSA